MITIKKGILEVKNTISKIKNSPNGPNLTLDTAEEAISKLEDRAMGIIKTKAWEKKQLKNNNGVSITYGIISSRSRSSTNSKQNKHKEVHTRA